MKQDYTTEALAVRAGLLPQSIRTAYCRLGHWCGIRPIKLPNRRLMWPAGAVEKVLAGDRK